MTSFGSEKLLFFILNFLYKKNIQSLIIEGGATLLNWFIKLNLWDEARVFIGPKKLKKGLEAPSLKSLGKGQSQELVGDDKLIRFRR